MEYATGLEPTTITPPKAILVEGDDWIGMAKSVIEEGVSNDEEHESAVRVIRGLKDASKSITDQMEQSNTIANAAHKGITTKRAELKAPFDTAEESLRTLAEGYMTEKERQEDAEAARIKKEAEDAAIAAAAEEQAKADIAAKKAKDEADKLAASLKKAGEEEAAKKVVEDAAHEADKIVAEGQEVAEQIVDATTQTLDATPPPPKAIMPAGSSGSTKWTAEVTDMAAFLKGAADGPHGTQFVEIKQGELNRFAQKCKGDPSSLGLQPIAGVTFKSGQKLRV